MIFFHLKTNNVTYKINLLLDYIAKYQFNIQSSEREYDLNVTADLYYDSVINARLLKIKIKNEATNKTYNYWINTNGGSIAISSKSGIGSDDVNSMDGCGYTRIVFD